MKINCPCLYTDGDNSFMNGGVYVRRVCAVLLILFLLAGGAFAQTNAYDLALELVQFFEQASDVRDVPLKGMDNRAIWKDSRADSRCALVVCSSLLEAQEAALADATRSTAVRAVKDCVLYLDSDMGADAILDYQLALAEILGESLDEGEPDYILNVNTKKFHAPACSSVEDMKETNKQPFSGEREDVIAQGYVPCKRCKP